jgi:hypothetical protein
MSDKSAPRYKAMTPSFRLMLRKTENKLLYLNEKTNDKFKHRYKWIRKKNDVIIITNRKPKKSFLKIHTRFC